LNLSSPRGVRERTEHGLWLLQLELASVIARPSWPSRLRVLWDPLIVVPGAGEPAPRNAKASVRFSFQGARESACRAPNWGANLSNSRRDGQVERCLILFLTG
jgi:hypothetical protein